MDKISVIIPAYNAEKTIKRCIDSILSGYGGGIKEKSLLSTMALQIILKLLSKK